MFGLLYIKLSRLDSQGLRGNCLSGAPGCHPVICLLHSCIPTLVSAWLTPVFSLGLSQSPELSQPLPCWRKWSLSLRLCTEREMKV